MLTSFRQAGAAALTAALLLPSVCAQLGIRGAQAIVSSGAGIDDKHTLRFGKWGDPIQLPEAATFKLSFKVEDKAGAAVAPQQAFIVFHDMEALDDSDDVTLAMNVKENGKVTFFMDTARVPQSLASTSGNLGASLILSHGDNRYADDLGALTLPSSSVSGAKRSRHSLPPRTGEPAFAPQPEITHTFKPDERVVGKTKSLLGVVAVMSPWVTLLGLIGSIYPSLAKVQPGTMMYVWYACLVALEGLILRYWVGWRLYQLLPPFLGLSAVTAYVGTVALRGARVQRLKLGGAP